MVQVLPARVDSTSASPYPTLNRNQAFHRLDHEAVREACWNLITRKYDIVLEQVQIGDG